MAELSFDFTGRAALITGAASGVGLATAQLFAEAGARVALLDRDPDALEAAAATVAGETLRFPADVTRSADLDAAVASVESAFGGLDILINSAGIAGASIPTLDVDDAEWERVLAVNASGTFFATRAALRGMIERGYGRIVNVASVAGKEGNPMAAAYSASKGAVIAMTKSIGKDVAGTGVLVNCVTPAPIDTPLVRGLSEEHVQYMLSRVPLARLATLDEAATIIAYLSSEQMSFSTGAAFDLSGGRLTY
ncbi:MAG: SDR family oxidoreductase [Gemmatimonadetes bacterium]|nr:SDR family oxidoreductase [Gemmatimonadota bacterium]